MINYVAWKLPIHSLKVFFIPEQPQHSKYLDGDYTECPYSPKIPILFPQAQNKFHSVLSEIVYPLYVRVWRESARSKPAQHEKTSRDKISKSQNHFWLLLLKRTTWWQKRVFWQPKKLAIKKVNTPPFISYLTWYAAVCFRSCFFAHGSLTTQSVMRQEFPKKSGWTKSHEPKWLP